MYAHVFKGKFDDLVAKLMKQGKTLDEAKALAAWIGMRKYGVQGFSNLAAAGKVNAANARAQKQENEMTGFAHVFKIGNGNNQYVRNNTPTQRAVSQERAKPVAQTQGHVDTAVLGGLASSMGSTDPKRPDGAHGGSYTGRKTSSLAGTGGRYHFGTPKEADAFGRAVDKHLTNQGFVGTPGKNPGDTTTYSHADGRSATVYMNSRLPGATRIGVEVGLSYPKVKKEGDVEEAVVEDSGPYVVESEEFLAAQAPAESVQKYGNGNNQWAKNFVSATTPRAKQINARVLAPSKTAILQAQRGYNTHLSTTGQKHGPDAKLEFLRANQSQQKHIGITALHLTAPPARPVKKAEGFSGDLGLMR